MPCYLLLRLIDRNDQIIAACDCKTAIMANAHSEGSPFGRDSSLSNRCFPPVWYLFLSLLFFPSIPLIHCFTRSIFFSFYLSQQWKSLFDKVCITTFSPLGLTVLPYACFTHCGTVLSLKVLICV